MQNLKLIENDLVPVYETSTGEKIVYGTELHKVLGVKSNYREWVNRRFSEIDALELEDFEGVEISTPSGQTKKEHIIKLDIAKEMSMLERNEKGKQIRRYFIAIEKKYKANITPQIPTDALGMAKLSLQCVVELEQKITTANERVSTVEKRMEVLEETSVVDSRQRKKLKDTGIRVVIVALGGKNSKAYNNGSLRTRAFQLMWHDYKEHFELTSYHDTPKARLDEAFSYLEMWEPPTNLKLAIKSCNEEVA